MSDTPRTDAVCGICRAGIKLGTPRTCCAAGARIDELERELRAKDAYAEQLHEIVGDETAKAAQLHTEAQRIMAPNEREFAAVYVALCTLRDRIAALAKNPRSPERPGETRSGASVTAGGEADAEGVKGPQDFLPGVVHNTEKP